MKWKKLLSKLNGETEKRADSTDRISLPTNQFSPRLLRNTRSLLSNTEAAGSTLAGAKPDVTVLVGEVEKLRDHGSLKSETSTLKPSGIMKAVNHEVPKMLLTTTNINSNASKTPSTFTAGERWKDIPPPLVSRWKPHKNAKKILKHGQKHGPSEDVLSSMYDSIPGMEMTKLPRGGVSVETESVGRIQFGIPPETIKDSMRLGLEVPSVYIVPVERFCREMGAALGVNLAEFEFPAYFNYFVQQKQCTLIVDSEEAERHIRRVFNETLLGPAHFRTDNPIPHAEEDFAPSFPQEARPNFQKELKHFRMMPDGHELKLETLIKFCHFEGPVENPRYFDVLGVPPPLQPGFEVKSKDQENEIPEMLDGAVGANEELNPFEETEKISAYSQVKLCGEVAVVYPASATQKDIDERKCRRVEIFKMPNWAEYIMHDINEDNIIVGKARISGNVRVSESMSIDGFGDDVILRSDQNSNEADVSNNDAINGMEGYGENGVKDIPDVVLPPTFHPPSFGVTVLGNSHGFDKSGSVSGYVLWINGRGIMIDPPPYSSATLEREGIRPRTIVGIILTHCHADHDAGAFQKVLTGSPVVVITTPTIYNSFIRKYAALASLSPALLRHSHRHKPAIIGEPMRFQGATFHFTYTLHTIPCVGFRVVWRGRSMVFTGDHFNCPEAIDKLQETGVLSKERADDLRNIPLQKTDLLLHEAGAPPIHTPLEVLLKLPQHVKDRLYVVHTQALPKGCELRVAPTGTKGTIRLDEQEINKNIKNPDNPLYGSCMYQPLWSASEYSNPASECTFDVNPRHEKSTYFDTIEKDEYTNLRSMSTIPFDSDVSSHLSSTNQPPLVAMRPTSSTDAWYTLNLLSAVPFLSSLSYSFTMEVLETARVDAFCINDVVLPAARRNEVLCVVWEGTCMEREQLTTVQKSNLRSSVDRRLSTFEVDLGHHSPLTAKDANKKKAVWHAGDWTSPRALQPEKSKSGESSSSKTHDIVAMSKEGVKVIQVEFASLHSILKNGSALYRTYLARTNKISSPDSIPECLKDTSTGHLFVDCVRKLNVLEVLEQNSTLRRLNAVQRRHLESLAEGPRYYPPGERLWRVGATVDEAFIIVAGTVSFVAKRRNAGVERSSHVGVEDFMAEDDYSKAVGASLGDIMRQNAEKVREFLASNNEVDDDDSSSSSITSNKSEDRTFRDLDSIGTDSLADNHEYAKLSLDLERRADQLASLGNFKYGKSDEYSTDFSHDGCSTVDYSIQSDELYGDMDRSIDSIIEGGRRDSIRRRRERFANKQLERLSNRRALNAGLVFSRGHFLGDISKMVAGSVISTSDRSDKHFNGDDENPHYGFGEDPEGDCQGSIRESIIHEQEGDQLITHSTSLSAGKDGCVVLVFPKAKLNLLLEEYPGILLSLLGSQVKM